METKRNDKFSAKFKKMFVYPIFSPNIFGIMCWIFIVVVFSLPEALRYKGNVETDSKIAMAQPILLAVTTIILLIWAISNDYTEGFRRFRKCFITLKLCNWIIIPAAVIFIVVYNGVFKMQVKGIDLNFSAIPIIIQMYLILTLYEIIAYTRRSLVCSDGHKLFKKSISISAAVLLAVLNIYFCIYFITSWAAWYRFQCSGIID